MVATVPRPRTLLVPPRRYFSAKPDDPVEFFAVATEAFFERPAEMRRRHAELYAVLARFYRQDPASLLPAEPGVDPATDDAPGERRRARPTGPRPRRRG